MFSQESAGIPRKIWILNKLNHIPPYIKGMWFE